MAKVTVSEGDGGDEALWMTRATELAPEMARAEAEFFRNLDAHRAKIGPCARCDWWLAQGLSPFCPPHEPSNNEQ